MEKSCSRLLLQLGLLLFWSTQGHSTLAQKPKMISESTTIFDERLDKSYKEGEAAFARYVGLTLIYPFQARTNGVMGLSVFSFRVSCDNKPYEFRFRTKLGFGIEEEIERVIRKTKGKWLAYSERDTLGVMNYRIAFTINNLYDSNDAFLEVSANGDFPGVSDATLIKDLEKATQKNNTEETKMALTKLFMRFPFNQEYRGRLAELNKRGR